MLVLRKEIRSGETERIERFAEFNDKLTRVVALFSYCGLPPFIGRAVKLTIARDFIEI